MEASLKETEDSKRVSDFKLISDELKRQFDLQMWVDDSHNPNLCRFLWLRKSCALSAQYHFTKYRNWTFFRNLYLEARRPTFIMRLEEEPEP